MVSNLLNSKGLGFFLLDTVIMTVMSFLVCSSCGQPQNDFESLLDAKGKYIWIWLAEEIFSQPQVLVQMYMVATAISSDHLLEDWCACLSRGQMEKR